MTDGSLLPKEPSRPSNGMGFLDSLYRTTLRRLLNIAVIIPTIATTATTDETVIPAIPPGEIRGSATIGLPGVIVTTAAEDVALNDVLEVEVVLAEEEGVFVGKLLVLVEPGGRAIEPVVTRLM